MKDEKKKMQDEIEDIEALQIIRASRAKDEGEPNISLEEIKKEFGLEDQEDIRAYHEAKAEHNGGPTRSLRDVEKELSAN